MSATSTGAVDRLLGHTTVERVERYVVWSLYFIALFFALFALFLVAIEGVGRSWTPVATVVAGAAILGTLVLHLRLARPAVEEYCGGPRIARRWLLPGLLVTGVAVAAMVVIRAGAPEDASPVLNVFVVVLAITPALCVWALLPRGTPGIVALCAVVALAPTAVVLVPSSWPEVAGPGDRARELPAFAVAVLTLYLVSLVIIAGMVISVRLSGWLLAVTRELDRARSAAGRLAVAEERLRFSRDLHDVVGRSLSGISLTSELAGALLARGRTEEAAEKIAAVRGLAADAQADMRAVVADYRRAQLADEVDAARRLVEGSGARWTTTLDGGEVGGIADLPEHVREPLAWVVREGTTNALRHARPTRVEALHEVRRDGAGAVRLTLTNDGVDAAPRRAGELAAEGGELGAGGHGLTGLRERLAPLGGTLEARREGDVHLLVCTLPLGVPGRARTLGAAFAAPDHGRARP